MIAQGFLLTGVGMGTVFVFLFILIVMMSNLERFVAFSARFLPYGEEQRAKAPEEADLAEIAAAVFIATRVNKKG